MFVISKDTESHQVEMMSREFLGMESYTRTNKKGVTVQKERKLSQPCNRSFMVYDTSYNEVHDNVVELLEHLNKKYKDAPKNYTISFRIDSGAIMGGTCHVPFDEIRDITLNWFKNKGDNK